MTMQSVNAHLMQALDFTSDDLAANRRGQLTARQQEDLKDLVAQGRRTLLIVAGVVILIVVAVIVYILLGTQGIVPLPEAVFGDNALLIVAVMSVVLVFYVIMLLVSLSRMRRTGSGAMGVKSLTGTITVKTQGLSGYSAASVVADVAGAPTTSYIVHIGREKIYTADSRVSEAFQPDIAYRIYVIGRKLGYIIVSAEALSAG